MVTKTEETNAVDAPLLSKSTLFEGNIAYLRIQRVADGLAKEVEQAYRKSIATNKVKGVVLDLRFAAGEDYAAAALFECAPRRQLIRPWIPVVREANS